MGKKLMKLFLWRFDSSPCSSYFIPCIATGESTERERARDRERGESEGNTENWAMADALVHSQKSDEKNAALFVDSATLHFSLDSILMGKRKKTTLPATLI
jgi:hypothetical protein